MMQIEGVAIEDTFAEAFGMRATRLVITAASRTWARHAAAAATGFATSVIACGCEAAIERDLAPRETPDGRPGVAVLLFAISTKELQKQVERRTGQCVLTCATTAAYGGIAADAVHEWLGLGRSLRYFGDGFQISKLIDGRRYWRIPVMEGEFLVEDKFGVQRAIGGGNFLILGSHQRVTLEAAELAVEAMQRVPGVVMPFPGGIVRSGSKVGSKYKFLKASTNHAYCPSLRGIVTSALPEGVHSVLEIVIDGLDVASIERATRAGILAACISGICSISAGNYGGNLGKFKFHLRKILDEVSPV